jgi:hypothetical protein
MEEIDSFIRHDSASDVLLFCRRDKEITVSDRIEDRKACSFANSGRERTELGALE